jgi:hypothetical protein
VYTGVAALAVPAHTMIAAATTKLDLRNFISKDTVNSPQIIPGLIEIQLVMAKTMSKKHTTVPPSMGADSQQHDY